MFPAASALDVDDRRVSDLIGACRKVADKIRHLPPIPETVEVTSLNYGKAQSGNEETRRLFGAMLQRIWALPVPTG
jgi:hypothetical protein